MITAILIGAIAYCLLAIGTRVLEWRSILRKRSGPFN